MSIHKIILLILSICFCSFVSADLKKVSSYLSIKESKYKYFDALNEVCKGYDPKINLKLAKKQYLKIVQKIKQILKDADIKDPLIKIDIINDYLYKKHGFSYTNETKDVQKYLIPSVLKTKVGNCISLSAVILCVYEDVGIDANAVNTYRHCLVQYKKGKTIRNIETARKGNHVFGKCFLIKNSINEHGFKTGIYMKPLTKKQFIGSYIANFSVFYYEKTLDVKAKKFAELALRFNPKSIEAMQVLGGIYLRKNDFKNSRKYLRKSFKLNNGNPNVAHNLYQVYKINQDWRSGLEVILKSLKYTKTEPMLYMDAAFSYFKLNDYDNAIDYSLKCLAYEDRFFSAYQILAFSYYAKLKYEKAIICARQAQQVSKISALPYMIEFDCYITLKQYKNALYVQNLVVSRKIFDYPRNDFYKSQFKALKSKLKLARKKIKK